MPRNAKRVRVEPGLYLAGDTYIACATPPGSRRPRWKTLGRVGVMEARRLRDEFRVKVRQGDPVTLAPRATFREVAEAYEEHLRRLVAIGELAPRTFETYESCLRHHAVPKFGPRQVSSLTPEDLVAWHRDQQGLGAATWTIRGRWIALRGVLSYAARHLGIPNPADRLTSREIPKSGSPRKRILSPEEMDLLLEYTPSRYHPAIATAMFSGMRASELLGLTWQDVDFAGEELHVRLQMGRDGNCRRLKTENGARDIVLMPALATVLRGHKLRALAEFSGDDDLVFATRRGNTIGHRNLSKRGLDPARTTAGLREVTFLALRHTFASILIAQGNDVVFVSRQLGHSKVSHTLDMYADLFHAARHARVARDALERDFGGLLRRHGGS